MNSIVLLSGGLDSAVCLEMARRETDLLSHEGLHALSFRYGQRHQVELQAAGALAAAAGAKHHVLDLGVLEGPLTTGNLPTHRSLADIPAGIPPSYVPGRNTVFIAYAVALAEVLGGACIWIGANADDAEYPDCTGSYFNGWADVLEWCPVYTWLRTPLLTLSKAEVVARALDLGVDWRETISCYAPVNWGRHCGACDACLLRRAAFKANGIEDWL